MLKITVFRVYFKTILYLVIISLTIIFLMKILNLKSKDNPYLPKYETNYQNITLPTIKTLAELKVKWIERKIARLSGGMKKKKIEFEPVENVDTRIHAFYYTWYKNEKEDGVWSHWFVNDKYPRYSSEMRTAYYPELGFYSSKNKTVIDIHMGLMKKAGIGVAIISWDEELHDLLKSAQKHSIKIALHWKNHGIQNLMEQLKIFIQKYGNNDALYKIKRKNMDKYLPVVYVYEAFMDKALDWSDYLSPNSNKTIRNSPSDAVFLALLTEEKNRMDIKIGHFDGFYTYFAANGYTFGSSWRYWNSLGDFAVKNGLIFIPCVAPGYNDGSGYSHPRLNGNYYEIAWKSALNSRPSGIAINSFNSWEEGSQIEPAVPKTDRIMRFSDYEKVDPIFYIEYTGFWVRKISLLGVAAMIIIGGAMTYTSDRRIETCHDIVKKEDSCEGIPLKNIKFK